MLGFDEQRLLGAAAARLDVQEPLEATFLPAFRALIGGLRDEARLSQVGAWRACARLMAALGQRVALAEFERHTPELAQVEIDSPIFVTGLPRAGTRLLHNLLARTPGLWAPRLWELQRPVPPVRIDERWIDRQIQTTDSLLDQLYEAAPELRSLHPMAATSPDACSWLFRNNFSSLMHALRWYMPSYVEFMLDADLEPAYRDHRRFLQILAHRHRHDDHAGPRLVLEDRWHLWHLDHLLAVYPDAWVIQIQVEREPALSALTRSCWTLQGIDAKRPRSPAELRRYCAKILDEGLAASERARAGLAPGRFIDIPYAKLSADPLAVVRSLGVRLRLGISDASLGEAARWLADYQVLAPQPRRCLATDLARARARRDGPHLH
ncbi:hypothetical protein ENSA5_36390 [Enhygromyxa salina]|uniref:Sulfotransferase domain protein n=1 Tax=Enhygromyxa salina TaxID=215803 RepID=A0A2S9XUP3_9BACT|nr:sulfotransferase [Enhygromyxa salina]PRP96563.1 hypothetical protein ENSA5_36390 [Enhygromyxa salina]